MTREDEGSGDLLDTNLRDEIELVSDLVVAASGSERHFTRDEVDALLGVVHTVPAGPAAETLDEAAAHTDEGAHG
ncbi:MAG: hypothetical protein L0H79_09130 [Intrasporangium sp.]|uniref:hypothetical protein n=1 Tax=Intrasporangium sp. TaxID=1925024 RepID=UPI002648E5AA|nr:hypothetical protein [Intrasporangium sp.]MDN5795897.1 hypothetical protein [Intrasporangium sp.]